MALSPICADLIETGDYVLTATDLHTVVCGGRASGYHPKVRGTCPDDGAVVGIAWYPLDYDNIRDAKQRAGELLRHVKALRREAR